MQQPTTSKNCPVCRSSIVKTDEDGDKTTTEKMTDEDRRTERLKLHLKNLKNKKISFLQKLTSGVENEWFNEKNIEIDTINQLLEENFENIIFFGKPKKFILDEKIPLEESKSVILIDKDGKIDHESLKSLGDFLAGILTQKNFGSNFQFCSPEVLRGEAEQSVGLDIVKMKMDLMIHLYRVYRARKHLDFTATRCYYKVVNQIRKKDEN